MMRKLVRIVAIARPLALSAVLALATLPSACSEGEPSTAGSSSGSSGTSGTSGTSGSSGTSGTSGASGSSGTSGTSGTSGASGGTPIDGIPADAAGMNAFLQKKGYASWPKESAAHSSTGPHGSSVLAYLNPKLDASLKGGAAEHPAGSAAVKEFLSGGQVTGWAAYVKTQPTSDGGKGWYWYEVFDTKPGASAIEGQGRPGCAGCHSTGKDFVQIPYPLQ